MKTIICDIDGTLVFHHGSQRQQIKKRLVVLPGVVEKFHEWDKLGYTIVLISGRRESTRKITENQLSEAGLMYDKLILGVGRGQRILINDLKEDSKEPTAISINLKRNLGLQELGSL
jgi:hypothetical protein